MFPRTYVAPVIWLFAQVPVQKVVPPLVSRFPYRSYVKAWLPSPDSVADVSLDRLSYTKASAPIPLTLPAPSYTYAPVSNPPKDVEIRPGLGRPDPSCAIVVPIPLPAVI